MVMAGPDSSVVVTMSMPGPRTVVREPRELALGVGGGHRQDTGDGCGVVRHAGRSVARGRHDHDVVVQGVADRLLERSA
jgi:hypothetical protein